MKNHPFHMVNLSPWPIMMSLITFSMMMNFYLWIYNMNYSLLINITNLILIIFQWSRDMNRESTFNGNHTKKTMTGLKWGMVMFIISELMLFLSIFWSLFHNKLSPSINIGMNWPPKSIIVFNYMEIPLINSMILISSGMSITWTHMALINNKFKQMIFSMMITILLGLMFSILQLSEYLISQFSIMDSIYSSIFFFSTGTHGIHVILGSSMLLISLMYMKMNYYSIKHHLSFEFSSWYWHFVDMIWLLLYISLYYLHNMINYI